MDHTGIPNKTTTRHLKVMTRSHKEKDYVNEEKYMAYVMRAYLILLVGTIIFSNKTKNYVDLTNLAYFRYLDQVATYSWGTVALAFLYQELSNATAPSYKYVAGYMRLLQVTLI
jgi:hypothetical protein